MNPIAIAAGAVGLLLLALALLLLRRGKRPAAQPLVLEECRPDPAVRERVLALMEQYRQGANLDAQNGHHKEQHHDQ